MKDDKTRKYVIGVMWFILSLLISVTNDVFQKYLGNNLHSFQIVFMRFLFGSIVLIPFMLFYGKKSFQTSRIGLHVARGALLFGGIALWCYGLVIAPITVATTLNFTIPLFILILAVPFLGEKVGLSRWLATIVGFVGVIFVLEPTKMDFNPHTALLLLSALLFASLDVINKKYVVKETMLAMLFFTALFTMILGAGPAFYYWQPMTGVQLGVLALLGCGANLILYCLLKGFAAVDASALAPFRYVELIFSAAFGFFIFGEIPPQGALIGAAIIIPSTFFIVYYETRKARAAEAIATEQVSEV